MSNINPPIPDAWLFPENLSAAADVQRLLAKKVILQDEFSTLDVIGGMDVSNNPYDPAQMVYAATVALDGKSLQVVASASAKMHQPFPYVPGFLGFREAPVLVQAFAKLAVKPSLILVDGHGISHPRGLGIASHIGVLLDFPTIGVAKSLLVGKMAGELPAQAGAQVPVIWHDHQIAIALRGKLRTNPLFISPGHKVSFASAVSIVQQCLTRYRLPEPTRHAHLAANVCRKESDRT